MTERGYFETFLFNPLSSETDEVAKSHAEALTNPTPEEESILLLVRGFLMYADQHRPDFDKASAKNFVSAGRAIQRLSGHGRLRKLNDYIQLAVDTIKSDTSCDE